MESSASDASAAQAARLEQRIKEHQAEVARLREEFGDPAEALDRFVREHFSLAALLAAHRPEPEGYWAMLEEDYVEMPGSFASTSAPDGREPGNLWSVNLAEKLAQFSEHWAPRTVAQFNGHDVMVVKVLGEFVWHRHDETDDLFLVLRGRLVLRLRDREVSLGPGELFVVPRGVEHQPFAPEETHLLLIEPTGTPNTGDAATAARREL